MSKLGLLARCQWWASAELQPGFPNDAADEGTRNHGMVATWLQGGAEPDAPWFPALMAWVDSWAPFGVPMSEAAYAIDIRTGRGRLLGVDLDRDYSGVTDTELAGTADAVWVDGDEIWIADWKFHGSDYADDISGAPDGFGQLMALAHAAMSHHGAHIAHVAYVHVWPRGVEPSVATVTPSGAFLDRLQRLCSAVPTPSPGPHCETHYCPAHSRCPATQQAAGALVPVDRLVNGIQTADDLAAWLEIKPKFEKLRKQLDREAEALLEREGGRIEFADGSSFRAVKCSRSGFDAAKAKALLTPEQAAECEKTTTYVTRKRFAAPKRKS